MLQGIFIIILLLICGYGIFFRERKRNEMIYDGELSNRIKKIHYINEQLNSIDELITDDFIPSFYTACYRLGRTGEHFMEFSVPGFIKKYCTPNAILTLSEYLCDYAKPELAAKGWKAIERSLSQVDPSILEETKAKILRIKNGERDLYF